MFGALIVTCGFLAVNALQNLSVGKSTNQTGRSWDGYAYKAVDGNLDTDAHQGHSCTNTLATLHAWWEVDLGKTYTIDHVIILGRTDCCPERLRDVQLLIGYGRNEEDYVLKGSYDGILPIPHTFQLAPPVDGRWVKITRLSTVNGTDDYLTLCEVEVMGTEMTTALENLAFGKLTYQTDAFQGATSDQAVDGQSTLTGVPWAQSCAVTLTTTDAWWEVDLGQLYMIDHVIVTGRHGCCSERMREVQLYIGYGRSEDDYVLRGFHEDKLPIPYTFQMTSPVYGRWVKISRLSTVNGPHDHLTLCEVEVMGNEMRKANFEFGAGKIGTGTVQKSSQTRTAAECCMQCMVTGMCPAVNYNFGTEVCEQLETVTTIDDSKSDTYFYRLP